LSALSFERSSVFVQELEMEEDELDDFQPTGEQEDFTAFTDRARAFDRRLTADTECDSPRLLVRPRSVSATVS
jgi:hypothetical protein